MGKRVKRRQRIDAVRERSRAATPPRPLPPVSVRTYLALAAIVVATFTAYFPAMQGSFIWDDETHVTKPELRSADGLYRIWFELGATQQYYPLLHSAFWLEHKLWGDNVLGYHLANVLLHAANACLAYFILRKLRIPCAWLAAAIFALHPVQVESVAWITEQKNTLSAFFYLTGMLAYLRFDESRQSSHYLLAMALFVLGLCCKTITATLPAALLVIFWWPRGRISWRRDVQPLIPFLLVGAVAGLFTAWVERTLIGAEGAEHYLSPLQRGLLAGRVIWFYLAKLLWPTNLTFIYPRWSINPSVAWQWLPSLAALGATFVLFLIRARWRAPLAAWLLFVGTLFPVLGFLNVYPFLYSFVADHFQYLASLAAIAITAAGVAMVLQRCSEPSRWVGRLICLVLLATLGTLTWFQSRTYSNVVTLYQTTIERNPACWLAYNNLGFEFAKQNRAKAAVELYQKAIDLNPNYALAHYNLANQFVEAKEFAQAIEHYQEAIRIRSGYPEAHNNLAGVLLSQGDFGSAIEHVTIAIRSNPNLVDAHSNLGFALLSAGKPTAAAVEFETALRLDPDSSKSRKGLADALMRIGRPQAAVDHNRKVLAAQPDRADVHNSLGVALAKAGELAEAIEHFETASRLASNDPSDALTAYANLTRAYAKTNRAADAIAIAEKAAAFARQHGQFDKAAKIEAWLAEYRRTLKPSTEASPSAEPAAASSSADPSN